MMMSGMLIYIIIGACFQKYKPRYGHETGVSVMCGIIFSLLFWWIHGNDQSLISIYDFDSQFFFDIILPPIVFNAGFNMKRKKFFENLGNITIFGLFVTLVCFILYASSFYLVLTYGKLNMTNFVTKET